MINPWKDTIAHWSIPPVGPPKRLNDVSLIVALGQIFVMLEYGWKVERATSTNVFLSFKGQVEVCEGSEEDFLLILALIDFCVSNLCEGQGVTTSEIFDSTMLLLAQHKHGVKIVCGRRDNGKGIVFRCPLFALGKVAAVMAMGIDDPDVLDAVVMKNITVFRDDLKRCQIRPEDSGLLQALIWTILR
jgi:hypothetical protein